MTAKVVRIILKDNIGVIRDITTIWHPIFFCSSYIELPFAWRSKDVNQTNRITIIQFCYVSELKPNFISTPSLKAILRVIRRE